MADERNKKMTYAELLVDEREKRNAEIEKIQVEKAKKEAKIKAKGKANYGEDAGVVKRHHPKFVTMDDFPEKDRNKRAQEWMELKKEKAKNAKRFKKYGI